MKSHERGRLPGGRGERGSAYIIVLLVLLLLTVIGLSLVLVTQNELQIGANERLVNRVFYAADAAIPEWLARGLVLGEFDKTSTRFKSDPNSPPGAGLGFRVDIVSAQDLDPSAAGQATLLSNLSHCALCEINEQAGGVSFGEPTYFVDVLAQRVGKDGTGTEISLAEKQLTADVGVQPIKVEPPAELVDSATGAVLANARTGPPHH